MIHDPTSFSMGAVTIDVNWNTQVTPCKKIRITLAGKEQIIDREDLYAMLMLFGDEEQQEQLIPVAETRVRAITRLLKIRAKKNIRQGEIIAVPFTYYVPSGVYEKLLLDKDYSSSNLSTDGLAKHINKQ